MLFKFGQCELDLRRHVFSRDGLSVPLEPQVFDLLALFLRHAGELVDRDRMMEEVWRGRIVSEATISSRINAVRHAIGDDGTAQAMLQTVPRRGFRFVVPVTAVLSEDAPMPLARPSDTQVIRVATSRDGTRIAHATTGRGPPLLRAGHWLTHLELDWTSPIWRPLLDRLGQSFSLTRYDQRCTGLSEAGADLSLEALADDLEAVADAAGLDRFPIFAASQGVPVAIAFAVRCPERVTGLVLYGGYAQGRTVRGTDADRRNAEAALTLIQQGWGRSGSAFAAAFAMIYLPDSSKEELQSMVDMQLASATPESVVAMRMAIDAYDVTPLLAHVTAPTLVVHAREDSVQPLGQARLLAAGIKRAQLHVLESRNHVPLPRDPAWTEIMQAVEQFLR
ncbi:MAG TPA: alpha/beta fold hydrolase [Mesorhizobium sp.]|jgi:DNA-binding winged helix-turn-helix (wHTH) protein|nr:alpha/beta fold hydrolase [Mesorhizobium sp.]